MRKITLLAISLLLSLGLFTGCSTSTLKNAEFTNTTPAAVKMNSSSYTLTDKTLSENEIGKQIGQITKINAIVSYIESDDPYKNTEKIFKIKDSKIEDAIAVEVNGKHYIAQSLSSK